MCLENTDCVGISYSHKQGSHQWCYVCLTTALTSTENGFNSYKKPAARRWILSDAGKYYTSHSNSRMMTQEALSGDVYCSNRGCLLLSPGMFTALTGDVQDSSKSTFRAYGPALTTMSKACFTHLRATWHAGVETLRANWHFMLKAILVILLMAVTRHVIFSKIMP